MKILDIPKKDDELIEKSDLAPFAEHITGTDLLIIRTGFGELRVSDPISFGNRNPGFAASAGEYLMEFETLRAIGMDLPSAVAAEKLPNSWVLYFGSQKHNT
nr:cyclase family protein [Paenibacillus sp. sptzw28]